MARQWRAPTEDDKKRKCYARNSYEKYPFYVEWNEEWNCWGTFGSKHILVSVAEILEAK